jgi:lipoyl-dependent peroxiredoxin subunit D
MAFEALAAALPAYARDVAQNLISLEAETLLTDQQKWGTFVASAHAVATPKVVQAIEAAAEAAGLSAEAAAAARGAAAIMAQNNVYFSAVELIHNEAYRKLPTRLRMNLVRNPGVEGVDFHLWCLAVSAIHGCPECLNAHEGALTQRGFEPVRTQAALRIGAVVHAVTRVIAGEAARAATPG